MEKLVPHNIEDILTLTPIQERILFHYLQVPGSGLYFEQLSLEISGQIDMWHFEKAWNAVIETNEMLRAIFRWEKLEKPAQVILKKHQCKVIFYDLSDKDSNQKKMALDEMKNKYWREVFDLYKVPFRVILCKLDEKRYQMVISNHHILYDDWSKRIILTEFFKAYHELYHDGRWIKLPAKPHFKEFIKWTHSQDRNKQEQFWREYLADVETPTELPTKRRIEKITSAEDYSTTLGEAIKGKLDGFAKNNRVTLASLFYTAWGILLQRYCNSGDVIFGTTVSGRSAGIKGIEKMVGLFINTIPLRTQTTPNEKIIDVMFRTDQVLREREEFENTPLVDIESYSSVGDKESLFDTIVAIENYPLDNRLVPSDSLLSVNSYSIVEMPHYDLSVSIMPFNEIEIKFSFKRELFDKETIENLAGHFKKIIQNMIEKPEAELSHLEIISKEKNRISYDFNNTVAEYPTDKTIHRAAKESRQSFDAKIGSEKSNALENPMDLSQKPSIKKIFISYSHQDRNWKERLAKHLKALSLQGFYDVWDDQQIGVGDDWKPKIEKAINDADIAILIVSVDFLGSNFIIKEEVPRLLERRKKGDLWVIPLFVKPCPWNKIEWLNEIQGEPRDGKTLEEIDNDGQADRILNELTEKIVEKIQAETQ